MEGTYKETERSPRTGLPSQSLPFEEDRSPSPCRLPLYSRPLCADPLSFPVSTSLQPVFLRHYEWTLYGIVR